MKIKYFSFHSTVFVFLLSLTHFSVNSQDFSIVKGLGFDSPNCGEQVLRIEIVNHNSRTFVWEKREKVGTEGWSAWMYAGEITPPPGYYAKIFGAINGSQNTYLQFRLRLKNSTPIVYSNVLERYLPGRNAGIITKSVQVACATGVDTVTLIANNYLGDIRWEYQMHAWNGSGYSTSNWFEIPGTAGKAMIKYGLYIVGPSNYFYSTGYNFRTRTINESCEAESTPTNFIYGSTQQNSTGSYFTLTSNKPMAVMADGNYSVSLCEGESIVLTGNHNAGYISYYKWSNGATTQSITVTEQGMYSFLGSWTGPGCERHASDKRVSVNFTSNPKPTVSSSSPVACSDANVTLSSSSGMLYYWSNGQQTKTIIVPSPGTYTVGVFYNNGCYRESDPVVLSRKPVITTQNKTICSGQSTDLTILSDVVGTTFSWIVQSASPSISGVSQGTFGTDGIISNALVNSSANTSGTVVYRVTPTANGCTGNYKDITITVNANTTGGVVAANQTICPNGDPAAFTQTSVSTGPGTLSYEWHTSLNNITYGNPVSGAIETTYNIPGGVVTQTTYYKRLTSSTQNGVTCSAYSNPVTITVTPLSGGLIAADQLICSGGNPATFTQTQAAVGPGTVSYQWQKSMGGGPFTDILPTITTATYDVPLGLEQTTRYQRLVKSSVCPGMNAPSNIVTVTVATSSTPTISQTGSLCDQYVTLKALSSGATGYVWSTGNTSQTVNMLSSGTYTVTATYANGCSRTSSPFSATIPTCNPNDPCNDPLARQKYPYPCDDPPLESLKTEILVTKSTAYPNPADATLTVHLPAATEVDLPVQLYSLYGQVIQSVKILTGENKVTFDTKILNSGVYLIKIESPQRTTIFSRRVVISH